MKEAAEAVKNIPEECQGILRQIQKGCISLGYKAYFVGGTVRDMLLGVGLSDIDITVVGDAEKLADLLGKDLRYDLAIYPAFKTVTLHTGGAFRIDIATARRETYSKPTALPEVFPSTLFDDLFRRDFTMNSMAVDLGDYALIDPFGGREDLRRGILRVLHDNSLIDDPTRIMRGLRFENRYGFRMDKKTEELIRASINGGYPAKLSIDRVLAEMEYILLEPRFTGILLRMEKTGLWKTLFGDTRIPENTYCTLTRIQKNGAGRVLFPVLALLEGNNNDRLFNVFISYKACYRKLEAYRAREKELGLPVGCELLGNGALYRLFNGVDEEILEYLAASACTVHYKNNIIKYMSKVRGFRFLINGSDLEAMGIAPGPRYKDLLERAREQIVDSGIADRNGQIEVLKSVAHKGE
jgi:tRNA nucleotidyltransferase (CCA-adding enzyme)